MGDFFHSIGTLLTNYAEQGWPFAFLHAVLLLFYLRHYSSVRKEIEELASWQTESALPQWESARILRAFYSECCVAGQHGVLVPMTDYSDRITSRIDHRVAGLHSLANFALVIGVMGTFFAVFQFAYSAKSGLPPEMIGRRLSEGLASAFPIGFIGLALSILFHYGALRLESRFRSIADEAIDRVLQHRVQKIRTVASILEQALEPLLRLEETLSRTLTPVIESFREELRGLQEEMARQVQPLADTVEKLDSTTGTLNGTISSFAAATGSYVQLLDRAVQIQKENLSAAKKSKELFERIENTVQASADRLIEAAGELATIPTLLEESLMREIGKMTSRLSEQLRESIATSAEGLSASASAVAGSSAQLERATQQFAELPATWTQEVRSALQQLVGSCQTEATKIEQLVRQAQEKIASESLEAWRNSLGTLSDHLAAAQRQHLDRILALVNETCSNLNEASRTAGDAFASVRRDATEFFQQAITAAQEELKPHLHRIRNILIDEYPRVLEHLQTAASHACELARQSEQIRAAYQAILADLAKSGDALHKAVEELVKSASSLPGNQISFEPIVNEMKQLPSGIARALNASRQNGPPVLLVKNVPLWKRI